ncbi:unnamed protein product [Amoebophrya sp. A120]|nr:unnamed protein product [Amoebophrya sp. A120]|eukprot:GSA120T00016735001.1
MTLLDPVCFLLQMPDTAYNTTYRIPPHWAALLLRAFIVSEPHIANCLARNSWMNQVQLHKEELSETPTLVVLCGLDGLIPAHSVRLYLEDEDATDLARLRPKLSSATSSAAAREDHSRAAQDEVGTRPTNAEGPVKPSLLKVLWFANMGHAEWVGFGDPFTRKTTALQARQQIFRHIKELECENNHPRQTRH